MYAVCAAQSDMNLPETGYANQLFQALFMNSDSAYQIHPIGADNQEIAARNLSSRLITLGYLLQANPESQDNSLQKGVSLYCTSNDLINEETITEDLQQIILSKDALPYSGYLELEVGDIGDACSLVNERLFELGYSQYSARPVIDEHTNEALLLFASVVDIDYGNKITPELQTVLFSDETAHCPNELAPIALEDSKSATPGQVITDKELKILRKWLTKSFAINHTDKQAVKRLQVRLIRAGYLENGNDTMVYDAKTADAVRRFQLEHGLTSDGIPSKKTLMELFGITNSTLSGE